MNMFLLKSSRIFLVVVAAIFSALLIVVNVRECSSATKRETQQGISVDADSLVEFAISLKGSKYCYGSCSPGSGFDCSGFVYYVFSHFGIKLPRSSYLMAEVGKEVELEDCQKGDLIFFTGTNADVKKVGHVGIVISGKGQPVEFIHSSSGKKNNCVVITPMSSTHYQKRFLMVKRLL